MDFTRSPPIPLTTEPPSSLEFLDCVGDNAVRRVSVAGTVFTWEDKLPLLLCSPRLGDDSLGAVVARCRCSGSDGAEETAEALLRVKFVTLALTAGVGAVVRVPLKNDFKGDGALATGSPT